jgi:hypothetical protein
VGVDLGVCFGQRAAVLTAVDPFRPRFAGIFGTTMGSRLTISANESGHVFGGPSSYEARGSVGGNRRDRPPDAVQSRWALEHCPRSCTCASQPSCSTHNVAAIVSDSGSASAFPEIRARDFPSSGVVSRGPGSALAPRFRPRPSIAGSDSRSYQRARPGTCH